MAAFDQARAIARYTELQNLISEGAYQERDIDGSYGEDGIEEAADDLIYAAAEQGLEFIWHGDHYTLEPMSEEDKAEFQRAQKGEL
jgi:hypothetical protein